jgi:hypothetical protein
VYTIFALYSLSYTPFPAFPPLPLELTPPSPQAGPVSPSWSCKLSKGQSSPAYQVGPILEVSSHKTMRYLGIEVWGRLLIHCCKNGELERASRSNSRR